MAEASSAAASRAVLAPLRGLRTAAIGFGAGCLVGALVGGLGARLIMRILFLANGSTRGSITANGNEVGFVTSGGTVALVMVGIATGAAGGILYVLMRRWLPGGALARGLLFGAFLLVAFGGGSIDADNFDFRIFGPTGLAVALFGLLPFAYGVALALLVDRWDSYIPGFFRKRIPTVIGYVVLGGLGVWKALDFAGTVSELV
jgi:hypothetical protein